MNPTPTYPSRVKFNLWWGKAASSGGTQPLAEEKTQKTLAQPRSMRYFPPVEPMSDFLGRKVGSVDEQKIPDWVREAHYTPCGEDEATYLVVGTGEIQAGKEGVGILAYCANEFTAHRCARAIRKNPNAEAVVLKNSLLVRKAIEAAILEEIAERDTRLRNMA